MLYVLLARRRLRARRRGSHEEPAEETLNGRGDHLAHEEHVRRPRSPRGVRSPPWRIESSVTAISWTSRGHPGSSEDPVRPRHRPLRRAAARPTRRSGSSACDKQTACAKRTTEGVDRGRRRQGGRPVMGARRGRLDDVPYGPEDGFCGSPKEILRPGAGGLRRPRPLRADRRRMRRLPAPRLVKEALLPHPLRDRSDHAGAHDPCGMGCQITSSSARASFPRHGSTPRRGTARTSAVFIDFKTWLTASTRPGVRRTRMPSGRRPRARSSGRSRRDLMQRGATVGRRMGPGRDARGGRRARRRAVPRPRRRACREVGGEETPR